MHHSRPTSIAQSFLLLLLFMSVSLLTVWIAFAPLSVSALRTTSGVIEENGKGLFVHTGDIKAPLFRVSPFDDYIYHADGKKVHIFDNYHFNDSGTVHTIGDAFTYYLHELTLPSNTFTWTITGPDGTVKYTATWIDKQITITRAIIEPDVAITAYGNSLVMCETCFVSSSRSAFFTGVYTTNNKLAISLTNGFTPVLITDILPSSVMDVTIRSLRGEALFSVMGDDGISYEEPWSLLEVKAKNATQKITLSQ